MHQNKRFKNNHFNKLFATALLAMNIVYANPLEFVLSSGFTLGLGSSGLSTGVNLNILFNVHNIAKLNGISSGIGLLASGDIFIKTFVNTKVMPSDIIKNKKSEQPRALETLKSIDRKDHTGDMDKLDDYSNKPTSKKAILEKRIVSKKDFKRFLYQYRQRINGIDFYRIVMPIFSAGGAITLHSNMSLEGMRFHAFIGPRIGFAAFKVQDAMHYFRSKIKTKIRARSSGTLFIKPVKSHIKIRKDATKIFIAFTDNLRSNKSVIDVAKGLAADTRIKFKNREGKTGAIKIKPFSDFFFADKDGTQEFEIDLKQMNDLIASHNKYARKSFNTKKYVFKNAVEEGYNFANMHALTAGLNAGFSVDFIKIANISIGLEASYQLDIPVKVFKKAYITREDLKNIQDHIQGNYARSIANNFAVSKIVHVHDRVVIANKKKKNAPTVYIIVPGYFYSVRGEYINIKYIPWPKSNKYTPPEYYQELKLHKFMKAPQDFTLGPTFDYYYMLNKYADIIREANFKSELVYKTVLTGIKVIEARENAVSKLDGLYSDSIAKSIIDTADAVRSNVPVMHKFNFNIKISAMF